MRFWQKIVLLIFATSMAGCSALRQDHTIGWSANQIYQAGKEELNSGGYNSAIDYYTKLLARYPYGALAQQGMLDLAYAYYRSGEPEKALVQLNEFIRTYPQHPYIDYAIYMKGVVEYEKNVSFFSRIMPINLSQTDPKALKIAFKVFETLVKRYPESEYAEDARYRMVFIRNLLGQYELSVADYYLGKEAYIAAINRAQSVLEDYEQTPSAPYALAIMARAYKELGNTQFFEDTMRVLSTNFPNQLMDPEIQHYLKGNILRQKGLWQRFNSKPKV